MVRTQDNEINLSDEIKVKIEEYDSNLIGCNHERRLKR